MDESEAKLGTQPMPEVSDSLFSTTDLILMAILVGGVSWYLLTRSKKTTVVANGRSYSIQ